MIFKTELQFQMKPNRRLALILERALFIPGDSASWGIPEGMS